MVNRARHAWRAVRWKMLIIFGFFSIGSTLLVACLSTAILNVVIRRESAYVVEERLKIITENHRKLSEPLLACTEQQEASGDTLPAVGGVRECLGLLRHSGGYEGPNALVRLKRETKPLWMQGNSFAGIVSDHGQLDIRVVRAQDKNLTPSVVARVPLSEQLLSEVTAGARLQLANSTSVPLSSYREKQELSGEIAANFVPGSGYPVPVVVVAHNWATGAVESWVICRVLPSYSHTVEELGSMGLRTASWVWPLGGIAFALVAVYGLGLFLSIRLSQQIVTAVDSLSQAAHRVGKGDFSMQLALPEGDQLGTLAASFNQMTADLATLREQDKQMAKLERDIALAQEAQTYLYPRVSPKVSGVQLAGMTRAANVLSGDLYDFFSIGNGSVGLLCADVSGKGVSAALMMAHLQAVAHNRLVVDDESSRRPSPTEFVGALNRDMRGRFGDHRYTTLFYGEYNPQTRLLRYVNGGHCPPIAVTAAGEARKLSAGDLPVGLFPDVPYSELQVELAQGSSILVYSDGLTEGLNSRGEEFGERRLMGLLETLPPGIPAEAMCTALTKAAEEWAAGAEQFDDVTILVLSVN